MKMGGAMQWTVYQVAPFFSEQIIITETRI